MRWKSGSESCAGSSGCPHWLRRRSRASARPDTLKRSLTLVEVLEQEAEDRRIRRVDRLRRASKLPAGKTWDTFEHERAPVKLRQQLVRLAEGDFVDRGVNVLAFGMPGTGKTHAMCAVGHKLVQSGRSVPFIPAYRLVQAMLAAKRDLPGERIHQRVSGAVPRQAARPVETGRESLALGGRVLTRSKECGKDCASRSTSTARTLGNQMCLIGYALPPIIKISFYR